MANQANRNPENKGQRLSIAYDRGVKDAKHPKQPRTNPYERPNMVIQWDNGYRDGREALDAGSSEASAEDTATEESDTLAIAA